MNTRAYVVLADGQRFEGLSVGASGTTTGEVVFTTGMTGYQEVLTDPSYAGQLVTMTAPQIGNTGVNEEDNETELPRVAGFIVHEMSPISSNWRSSQSLPDYLESKGIVAITGVDTRSLTRHIRDTGAQMAAIGTESPDTLQDMARAAAPMTGRNLADEVSTRSVFEWTSGNGRWALDAAERPESSKPHVVAIDFGVKHNILRCLVDVGCRITVVPSTTSAKDILDMSPDGVFLSNGPGDPGAVEIGTRTVSDLVGKKPLFGICLGHQLLCRALGGTTYKLKFGHRGLNHPVKDLATGRIEVTTQNHGFCVDVESLGGGAKMSHQHLNDGTCMGIEHRETGAFSVQYHPEASAGPHDAFYLFERFLKRMDAAR